MFTKQQIEEIALKLRYLSKKDSELEVSTNIDYDDCILSIVSNSKNYKISISDFFKHIKTNNLEILNDDGTVTTVGDDVEVGQGSDKVSLIETNELAKGWYMEKLNPTTDEPNVKEKYVLKDTNGNVKGTPMVIYKDNADRVAEICIRYDSDQPLTDTEKEQARKNIDTFGTKDLANTNDIINLFD